MRVQGISDKVSAGIKHHSALTHLRPSSTRKRLTHVDVSLGAKGKITTGAAVFCPHLFFRADSIPAAELQLMCSLWVWMPQCQVYYHIMKEQLVTSPLLLAQVCVCVCLTWEHAYTHFYLG